MQTTSASSIRVAVRALSAVGLFLSAGELAAHPGHGSEEGWSLLHWLGEPEHFIPLAGALLLGGLLSARRIRRRSSR